MKNIRLETLYYIKITQNYRKYGNDEITIRIKI